MDFNPAWSVGIIGNKETIISNTTHDTTEYCLRLSVYDHEGENLTPLAHTRP